jgi:DNA repair exonuclease SbcCD ATPase subunit
MIIFEKIRWKNLLSTGNAFTEVDFTRSPNTLIIGENGAGKSTILDALCFVLFDKPFRKIKKGQLVNSVNDKGCLIEIEFKIGNREYKVIRGIKPQKFEIYQNGKLLNQPGSKKDYQDTLERQILRLNYKSFTQIVILGNASFTPFMQLKASDRRMVIEDLLDIGIFSSMGQLLKEKIANNKNERSDVDYNLKLCDDRLSIQKQNLKEKQKQQKEGVKAKQKLINEYQNEKSEIIKQGKQLAEEVKVLAEDIVDTDGLREKIREVERTEQRLEDEIKRLNKEIKFYEDNDHCPTCEQELDDVVATTHITQRKDKITALQNKSRDTKSEWDTIRGQLDSLETKAEEHSKKTQQGVLLYKRTRDIDANIQAVQEEIENLQNTVLDSENSKITELETQLQGYRTRKESLLGEKELLDIASVLLKDTGVKSKIIKQYVPIINKLVNKYLAAMEFFVQFELDENFEEKILSRHRDDFSYASFSEGEKMRIDLALLFTWRAVAKLKNSTNTNLLILDEVFDASLDTNGCDEFLKLLHGFGEDTNVFVISHKGDILYDKFRSVIRFEKYKNFSRIAK